jgi:PAS domain-containing protein
VKGDARPFLDFMAHLIPFEQDREAVLRWLATLIARRDIRMRYSLLLISKRQGVGKSTLGYILKLLLGTSNVSFPNERSIADSAFNGWALGKLLIFVNEIYSNGNSKVYDKLKPYVTDDEVTINEKQVKEFTVQNWAVFIACSNSEKALFIPDDDRRWLIPTVTESLKDREWWEGFYSWLHADGAGIILDWAKGTAAKDWVRTGERAPETTAKRAIISASKSEGRLLARDFGEEFASMDPAVVKISEVRAWIAGKRGIDATHPHLEKERLIIDELEGIDGLRVWKGDQRPRIDGRRGAKAAVVFNFEPEPGATWSQLERFLKTPKEIGFDDAF